MKHPGLEYASPVIFSRKQRLALAIIPAAAATAYKLLMHTCRVEIRGEEHWERALSEYGHGVLGFWHETLGMAAYRFRDRDYHTLTSFSYDGEIAARVVNWFGIEALRGSSSRGGVKALQQMKKALEIVPAVGLTLDGPRGPRRVAKPGAAIIAARSGLPVVPMAHVACSGWRLHSWDRFIVPRPFSRVICSIGTPIPPPEKASSKTIEAMRVRMEQELNALHATLEDEAG